MGSQTELTISLVCIVLFSIAIISFAVGFANDNNADISISDDENVTMRYYSMAKDNSSSLRTDSEDTYTSIIKTEVEAGSDVVKSSGSFTITWSNVFGAFKNIYKIPQEAIFGGSGSQFGLFFTALIGIIVFLIALYIIKTWRGNP